MNDNFTNKTDHDNEAIAQKLNQVAEETHADSQFKARLEEQLRSNYRPGTSWFVTFGQISPAFRWVALMVLLALVLSWSIKNLIPASQLAVNITPRKFVCPVTIPNGSQPYGKTVEEDPNFHGNGQLWTKLWPNGKIYLSTADQMPDGSFTQKWYFERGIRGILTVEGHRLDAESAPLRADIPDGYGDTGLQVLALIFPTTGCWEVTGRVGNASLTFVTEVLFAEATPTPNVVISGNTATPIATEAIAAGYDFRGAKLYLAQPLPESPDKAHIYLLKKDEPATLEGARLLADRFGIQGEVYTAPDYLFGKKDYAFSDEKQLLQVYSNRYFSYTADMAKSRTNPYGFKPSDRAETTIEEFLKRRGFDFPFSLSEGNFPGEYFLRPLAPDSIPMQYESFTPPVMRVALDENGEVLSIDATLMDYEAAPVGEYGIISAQEAFQVLLNDHVLAGKMEFFNAPDRMPREWYRSYPDNQPVTIYGYISSYPTIDSSQPALIFINGVSVKGNVTGLESLEDYTFVEARGQYLVEKGIRRFQVDSWTTSIEPVYISGTLQHADDQIILTASEAGTDQQAPLVGPGKQYPLIDPPADLPFDNKPNSQLNVQAVLVDGKLFWTYIQYLETTSHGGGGGSNGLGFYKLNFSGTPVPFPTATQQPNASHGNMEYVVKEGDTCSMIAANFGVSIQSMVDLNQLSAECLISVGQHLKIPSAISTAALPMTEAPNEATPQNVQDLRGFLSIVIHKKVDGSESKEYTLWVNQDHRMYSYQLNGPNLGAMDGYNALPVLVSGIIRNNILEVDSYKIPFPNLEYQIAKGTQRSEQLDGQTVVIFTTENGQSYVEFMGFTERPTDAFLGNQGDLVQQEFLIVPDETFAGMPVARIHQGSIYDPSAPLLQVQANQLSVIDDSANPDIPINNTPPNLTIDRVELVYYVSNPYYQINDPNYSQRSPYIQPVWHFRGRYEDGGEFDILIQALKQEFLLPELAPHLSPG